MGRKVGGMWDLLLYIGFVIKCEWNELVECRVHLPIMVKEKWDIYWQTDEKGKMRHLIADRRSRSLKLIKYEGRLYLLYFSMTMASIFWTL